MAKNKTSVILLSVAAVAVWGIVGYRVFRWVTPEEVPVVRAFSKKEKTESTSTDSLMLNYRDPFFADKKEAVPERESLPKETTPAPALPAFSYKGLIRDADGSVRAMVTHGRQTDGYRKGEMVDGAKIIAITADCLTVRWHGTDYNLEAK